MIKKVVKQLHAVGFGLSKIRIISRDLDFFLLKTSANIVVHSGAKKKIPQHERGYRAEHQCQ